MIDMHVHSSISDGTKTPAEIIRKAKKIGLKAVALTDHDSIDGLKEAAAEAKKLGVTFIQGIEFSVSYGEGRILHVLGLGIDPDCEGFMIPYTNYRRRRSTKLGPVFDRLREMGVDVTPSLVEPYVVGGFMDRQAIAKYLVAQGYVTLMKYAWINYIDHIPYAEGELIDPQTAIDAIHAAGGKAIMAHFHLPIGLKGYTDVEVREKLQTLKAMGLDGMEYYYPSFTTEDQLRVGQYIAEYDFIKSGGSDFHGANRAHIQLGIGEGDFRVPDALLTNILPDEDASASA